MTAPRRHRPAHLLWTPAGYVAACTCHYFQPVRFDRPLPAHPSTGPQGRGK